MYTSTNVELALTSSVLIKNISSNTTYRADPELSNVLQEGINTKEQAIIFTLNLYRLYQNGWDGYDGIPPSSTTVDNAIQFMKNFSKDLALPYTGLAGDGQIDFFWEQENIFIDIGFIGDSTYSYFARDSKGKEYFGDDIALSKNLPKELIDILKKL